MHVPLPLTNDKRYVASPASKFDFDPEKSVPQAQAQNSRFVLESMPGKDGDRRASSETSTTINHLPSFNMLIFRATMQ